MLSHPSIAECAVVGIPDTTYGERIAASKWSVCIYTVLKQLKNDSYASCTIVVVLRSGAPLDLEQLQVYAKEKLAPYKLPRELKVVCYLLPREIIQAHECCIVGIVGDAA